MKRMLINGTQAEERRLAIVDGQKLLDYEISSLWPALSVSTFRYLTLGAAADREGWAFAPIIFFTV